MKKAGVIFLLAITCLPIFAYGQSMFGSIEGRITDKNTGEPLAGVNIIFEQTLLGTTSDLDGFFHLSKVHVGQYRVKANMMGYKSQSIAVQIISGQKATANFQLEETVIETPTLVVSASKKAQSFQDVPNSVSLISLKEIERRNKTYLDELLEYTPGVYLMHGEVNIRGSSGFSLGAGSRVLLLIDGIPMMPGDSGDIKWDVVPLSQIERVEIVKGAGSALYGSHALGGVINIITKDPKSKPTTSVQLSTGIYNKPYYPEWEWTNKTLHFEQTDITHSRKIGNLGLLISGGMKKSTGYQQNGDYERYTLLSKMNYKFTQQSSLTIHTNFTGGDYGDIYLWRNQHDVYQMPVTSVGDWVRTKKFSFNTVYRQLISSKFTYKIRGSYFYNDFKQFHHNEDNLFSNAQKTGIEAQADYILTPQHTMTAGIEGIFDNTSSEIFGDHNGYTIAGYIQDEISLLKTVSATLGGRFDYHHVDTGVEETQFNPKLGLNYKPSIITTVRASVGRGFRTPTMAEMFTQTFTSGFKVIPNPNLKAESAWSYEVGLNQIVNENLILDIALFQNDYKDFIEPEPDIYQTVQFKNVSEARIRGLELNIQGSLIKRHLIFNCGYTYMDPIDKTLNETLAYRPNHLLTSGVTFNYSIYEFGFDYRFISKLDNVKVYPNDDRVAQKIWDFRCGTNLWNYNFSININNLFQYNYLQVERNIGVPRNYVITVTKEF